CPLVWVYRIPTVSRNDASVSPGDILAAAMAMSDSTLRTSRAVATQLDYRTLADLRYQIRRFLRVREVAARAAGVEPQQYLLLLQIKGLEGREVTTIRVLAERLQIHHHAMVQLIDRLVGRRMVERQRQGRGRPEVGGGAQ